MVLLAGALLSASPAPAQDEPGRSELEESLGRPRRTPVIPPELRGLVREATRDRIVVRGTQGDIPIDISNYEPEDFQSFGDGRFLGFSFMGYEFAGYTLIDRRQSGEDAVIATGVRPAFSSDGRHFAAVQLSGAEAGNLEGLGIWRVDADGTTQVLFSEVLPRGEDWRIDGWPRADCVSVSWIERQAADGEPSPRRRHFGVEVGAAIRFANSGNFPGCNVTDATSDD